MVAIPYRKSERLFRLPKTILRVSFLILWGSIISISLLPNRVSLFDGYLLKSSRFGTVEVLIDRNGIGFLHQKSGELEFQPKGFVSIFVIVAILAPLLYIAELGLEIKLFRVQRTLN